LVGQRGVRRGAHLGAHRIVYSLLPYGGHTTGWTNPGVLVAVFGGIATLAVFVWIERRVENPCSD